LAPDTYTIAVGATSGYDAASISGVTVQADQNLSVSISQPAKLKQIGSVTSRAASALVKPGTTADVYSINAVTQDKASGVGGGGNLNTAWSAIATVPGVFITPNLTGYIGAGPAISIRGGDYDQIGYELDGVPVNDGFNFTGAPVGSLLPANYAGGGVSRYLFPQSPFGRPVGSDIAPDRRGIRSVGLRARDPVRSHVPGLPVQHVLRGPDQDLNPPSVERPPERNRGAAAAIYRHDTENRSRFVRVAACRRPGGSAAILARRDARAGPCRPGDRRTALRRQRHVHAEHEEPVQLLRFDDRAAELRLARGRGQRDRERHDRLSHLSAL
jgi:hypothetical protein